MSSKTVNEDLLIVTKGSGHVLDTVKTKDECFLIDKKTIVPYRNYIPSKDCADSEATEKTFIRRHRIIHNKSKVGPPKGPESKDDDFEGFGGGIANGQVYYQEANNYPGDHSKNVKVEGHWIVRTDDETQQNHRNCTGKFVEGDGGITEDDLEALLNKGCTIESLKIVCDHRDTATDRICVLEGDKVTVTMTHVNDAEVEPEKRKKPACQVPRRRSEGKLPADAKTHPYYRVTRSAYPKTSFRDAMPAKTELVDGIKLTLGKDWLGEGPKQPKPSRHLRNEDLGPTPQRSSDSYDRDKIGQMEGDPPVRGERMLLKQRLDRTGIPEQQEVARRDANAQLSREAELRAMRESMQQSTNDAIARENARLQSIDRGRENTQAAEKSAALAITTYKALKEIFYAKPVEVKIEALACAGAKPVAIAAYPPEVYTADLVDLEEFVNVFKAAKDSIEQIRAFIKKIKGAGEKEEGPAGSDVTISVGRFMASIWILKDAEANFSIEYRELERDSTGTNEAKGRKKHEVFRAYTLDLGLKKLIGVRFCYSVPITYAAGAIGAFAQKLLDKVGTDLSFKFEIELTAGVYGAAEVDQYGKLNWLRKVTIAPKVKVVISLNATTRGVTVSIGVRADWGPKLQIQIPPDKPVVVERLASKVEVKWFVKASVNIFGWTVDWEYGDYIWPPTTIAPARYAFS